MSDDQIGAQTGADAAPETGADSAGEIAAEAALGDTPAVKGAPGPIRRLVEWCRPRRVAVLLAAALLVSALTAASVFWWIFRPDRLTDEHARDAVTEAAREGTVAILSYAPDTLDKDLEDAKSHLTGPFLKYYSDFTSKMVAPAAKQKGIKTEATVVRAAVSDMHPDRAVVLVFVNQVSTSKERPDPTLANSSVMVTLVKSGGRWLISEFNPV